MDDTKTVRIPALAMHNGFDWVELRVKWVCPKCGGPRGEVHDGLSYDGSRRLGVHLWTNPCGHVDYYSDVRKEASENGLNEDKRGQYNPY